MKKLIFFFLFLFSFTFVFASSCNPDSGFDWCYESTNNDHSSAVSHAEVQGTYPECSGEVSGNKCVGDWTVNIKGGDDNLYLYRGITTWTGFWDNIARCGTSGCSGQRFSGGRTYNVILNDASGKVPGYVIVGWDYASSSSAWSWKTQAGGYTLDFFNLYTVDCLNGKEECSGNILRVCENYKMVTKGIVLDKCGIECISDSDCNEISLRIFNSDDQLFCSGNTLMDRVDQNFCSNNMCDTRKTDVVKQVCDFECRVIDGKSQCLESEPIFKNPIFLISGGIMILLTIGTIIFFARRKRK